MVDFADLCAHAPSSFVGATGVDGLPALDDDDPWLSYTFSPFANFDTPPIFHAAPRPTPHEQSASVWSNDNHEQVVRPEQHSTHDSYLADNARWMPSDFPNFGEDTEATGSKNATETFDSEPQIKPVPDPLLKKRKCVGFEPVEEDEIGLQER